jgi:hypothetical protein
VIGQNDFVEKSCQKKNRVQLTALTTPNEIEKFTFRNETFFDSSFFGSENCARMLISRDVVWRCFRHETRRGLHEKWKMSKQGR